MEFKLQTWLNGYKKSCTSEFNQLMSSVRKQITMIRVKKSKK